MKKLLVAMFVALLMVGCGEDQQKPGEDSPESNQSAAGKVDLDDPETRNRIITEAIDFNKLQKRGELFYAPNQQTPYTGRAKYMHDNGQIKALGQFKDGKIVKD